MPRLIFFIFSSCCPSYFVLLQPKVNEADQAAEKHAKLLQSAALQATPADAATAFAAAAVFLGRGERPPSAEEVREREREREWGRDIPVPCFLGRGEYINIYTYIHIQGHPSKLRQLLPSPV